MAIKFVLNETSYFGENARETLVEEIKKRGFKKVFLVSDKSLVEAGVTSKVEKILTKTKQYTFKKDKSNLLVELFAMFGGIICVIGYLIREFKGNVNRFSIIDTYLCIGGGALFFVSALSMQYRYYLSGYEDLNMSMVSDYTI